MSKLINDEVRSEYTFPHLYSQAYVEEKNKEINRLNNIINKLEKWLEEETRLSDEIPDTLEHSDYTDVLDKLKALKENNNE